MNKIEPRLEQIQLHIDCYTQNIKLLMAYAEGRETLKDKGCTDSASRYIRTSEDDRRLPLTLQNLRFQIAILEREREVLLQYAN